MDEFIL